MKPTIKNGVVVLFILLSLIAVAYARAIVLTAQSYVPQNCVNIAGWDWIRKTGAQAKWVFDTAPLEEAEDKKIYLNIDALATNTINGGSGYGVSINIKVVGSTAYTKTVKLTNHFRPQDPDDSRGVGYRAFGRAGPFPMALLKDAKELTVTVAWPTVDGNHIAVNKNSVTIAYIR